MRKHRLSCHVIFCLIVCLLTPPAVCPRAAGQGTHDPRPAAPASGAAGDQDGKAPATLWLGDPDVDIDKARAAYRAKFDAAQRWETDADLAAYDHVGTRDPSWDDDARLCIRMSSLPTPVTPTESQDAAATQRSSCQRALAHGCTDPFLTEIGLWLGLHAPGATGDQLARSYTEVESALAKSDYPPLCKYVSAANTVQRDVERRLAPDNTIGRQSVGYAQPARSWPQGTDVKTAFQHACAQLEALVKDPAVPPMIYMGVTETLFLDASSDPIGRAEVLVPLAKFFDTDETKDHPTYGFKLVAGRFWIDYAWDARGGDYAGAVSDEGWKLFGERLAKAKSALTDAWKLDPADRYAQRYMITVAMGLGSEREEMETWFRRAMDARPNDYAAGFAKMLCLEPKWGGSWEAVLEFGRQCYATRDWSTRMAMLLLSAHIRRSKEEDDPKAYWKAPDVWADVRNLYTGYLAAYPASSFDRTSYALYAAYAGQWTVAHEQFELVGDMPSGELLRLNEVPLKEYQKLRQQAAEHARESAPSENAGS